MHRFVVVALLVGTAHAQPDAEVDAKIPPVPRDVVAGKSNVNLPAQPAFDLPPTAADGTRSARELRLRGKKLIDSEIVIKGVITWAYDCMTAIRGPNDTDKEVRKRIDDDPSLCERPKFYVGEKGGRPETSIWVVDVPRVYNKLELTRIKKPERTMPDRCEPDDKKSICPPYKVGDEVVVRGTFALSSPHSERNTDGLIVYKRMRNLTQNWDTPLPSPPPVATTSTAMRPWTAPPLDKPGKPVWLRVKKSVFDASQKAADEGVRADQNKQYDVAIERLQKSVDLWKANHGAWYWMALAFAHKADWKRSADAAEQAVQLDPTIGMYRLLYGRALYERAIRQAREDLGRKDNRRPEDVTPDFTTINFEKAFLQLSHAVALDPALWRAHYLLGKIHGYGDRPKESAAELIKATSFGPPEAAPWIALAELYRSWDYTDQAIQVAMQGAALAGADASDLWVEVGSGQDEKHNYTEAVTAYTKALALKSDNQTARFGRGQAYFKLNDLPKAKSDLEAFLKSGQVGSYKVQASRMLMEIAARSVRP